MSQRSKDFDLTEAIRRLPRFRASNNFTANLIDRLEERQSTRFRFWPRLSWLAAGVVAMVIGIWIVLPILEHRRQALAYRRQVEAIRGRYERLQADVVDLRRTAARSPAVVYLGGDESVDLVVDLADLAASGPTTDARKFVPTNYSQ